MNFVMADLLPTPSFSRNKPVGFGTRQIYAYTDEDRYEGRIAGKKRPRLKVGGTDRKVARDRIDEQDGTSQPVALVQKRVYTTTFWDTGFHKWLEDHGYVRVRKNREWFEIYVEELDKEIEAYSKYLESYSYEIKGNYTPRTLQTKVSKEVCNRWIGNTIIQPLDLCPRFGKDFTHLDIFQRSGLRVMIIASYWLGSNESLIKTVNERLDISANIEVIKPDYDLYVKALREGKRVLIDVSLHVDSDKIDGRLLDALKEEDALIVVDEADYGAWTNTSRSILQQYTECGNNLVLLSTGSNIERAMIGAKGDIQIPIRYTYTDLIASKKQGDETYKELVEVTCYNLDATSAFIDEQNNMLPEDRLNMKKLFDKRNSHVQREFKKQVLFDKERGNDVFGIYSRHWGQIDHPAVMVWCPTTKLNLNSLAKVCKDPDYNIIVLHGDEHTNRGAEKYVKESIKQAKKEGKEGTVIFSCGMGARSFSIPNIIATVDCFDGGSLAPATQRASRCLTPGCDKEMSLVVNYTFNPNRSSSFETDLISSEINKDGDADSAVRRIHGIINTLKDRDTFMSEKDFLEYITSSQNLTNMASAVTFPIDEMLNDDILFELSKGIKSSTKAKGWEGVIQRATTYIEEQKSKGMQVTSNDKNANIKDFSSKILTITKTAGNTSYLAPDKLSFKECLEVIYHDTNKNSAYQNLVGLSAGVVLEYFLPYATDTTYIDLIVSRNSKCKTYDEFDYEHSSHPEGLFDDVLEGINNTKILYLAKEPGRGVLSDLEKCSSKGEVWVLACLPGYIDFYRKLGYNTLSLSDLYLDLNMDFDVVLGNSPFQSENKTGKKGKGGNNALYLEFIDVCVKQVKNNGGIVALITPPAGLVKSTELGKPTKTLTQMLQVGSLTKLDLTTNKHFKDVGTPISSWTFLKGVYQDKVNVIGDYGSYQSDVKDIYFLPPTFDKIELELYQKIVSNKEGERLVVVRGKKNQPCTMARFGYPKVQYGGDQELGFDEKFYQFFTSRLGLWLLDYIRRHEQMIYHNSLTGIMIPEGGFLLTKEEDEFLKSRKWINHSKKEEDV